MRQVIATKEYITNAGDSFDGIAFSEYGNEELASEIIDRNLDYCDVVIFGEGVKLTVPVFDEATTPETLPPWRTEAST